MNNTYTVEELANKLKVHPRTIRRRIEKGEIKAVKIGRQYRIDKQEVYRLWNVSESNDNKISVSSVSSIIQLENISTELNLKIDSQLTAFFLSGNFKGSLHSSYNKENKLLKLFIDTNMDSTPELFTFIKKYIETI